MMTGLVSWCIVSAALGQVGSGKPAGADAPGRPQAEAGWLEAIPADVAVALRVRGAESLRDDLLRMLGGMAPGWAGQVGAPLEQALQAVGARLGARAISGPLVFVLRLPRPGELGTPPYAVLVEGDDYTDFQRRAAAADGQAKIKVDPQAGGFDEVKGPVGPPVFTCKGAGFFGMSNSPSLLRAIAAKRPGGSLAKALAGAPGERWLGGDCGLYFDLGAIQARYRDEIDQMRQQLTRGLSPEGRPGVLQAGRAMYDTLFDALRDARALVLQLDFAPEGLTLQGAATVKPGSATARQLASYPAETAEELADLPADLATYCYSSGPASLGRMKNLGLSALLDARGKPTPAMQRALDLQQQAGIRSLAVGSGSGAGSGPAATRIRGVAVARYADPDKAVAAMTAMVEASKASQDPLASTIKSFTLEPTAREYRGFRLSHSRVAWDPEKLAQLVPEVPGGGRRLKAFVGETCDTWFGTDGKAVVSVVAARWEEAKAQLDSVQTGQASLGRLAAYQALRRKLPDRCSGLLVLCAQGFVRQLAAQLTMLAPDSAAATPTADLPKDPVLLGGSFLAQPDAVLFQAVVPGAVGEVFAKGILPVAHAVQETRKN